MNAIIGGHFESMDGHRIGSIVDHHRDSKSAAELNTQMQALSKILKTNNKGPDSLKKQPKKGFETLNYGMMPRTR